MSKHTPWEWRAVFPKKGRPYVLAGIRSPLHDRLDPEERAANARLIAASPDLLEALKAMHAAFNSNRPLARDRGNALEVLCRAAIAKAERG